MIETRINPPIDTVSKFIDSWRYTPKERLKAELVTVHKESNGKVDNYNFDFKDGKLIEPDTGRPIESFCSPGVEKDIVYKLEDWMSQNDSGLSFWFSPRSPELKHVFDKVIIGCIAYDNKGEKILVNTSVMFDGHIKNSLRDKLFTSPNNPKVLINLFNWIDKTSRRKLEGETLDNLNQLSDEFADMIFSGIDKNVILQKMIESKFIGVNPLDCDRVDNPFMRNSNILMHTGIIDRYGSLEFSCPSCHKKNTRPQGILVPNCKFCGASVRC